MADETRPEGGHAERPSADDEPRQLDLLTIGLVVFFVALIGTVAAMLYLTIR